MAGREGFLIDTSAAARILLPKPLAQWSDALESGLVGMCAPTELELLYSATSLRDYERMHEQQSALYAWRAMPDSLWIRLQELQLDLAKVGAHRSAGPVDLMVAVTAQHHGLTVLHYDRDFETIARVTGQPVRWLVEPGSIA